MIPALRPLAQLLLSPAAFFDERPPKTTLPIAVGIVVLYTIALVLAVSLVGSMLAGAIDATVTMDNPDRPPEMVCEMYEDDADSLVTEGCSEPETVERDAGELVQEAVHDYLVFAVFAPLLLWALGTGTLYAVGRLAGGTPSFTGVLSLAGWAALPEFVRLAIGLVGLRVALSDVIITDVDRSVDALEAAMAPIDPLLLVASLATIGWQWYLLTGGLASEADIPKGMAALGVGIPLGLFSLVTLF